MVKVTTLLFSTFIELLLYARALSTVLVYESQVVYCIELSFVERIKYMEIFTKIKKASGELAKQEVLIISCGIPHLFS